MNILVQERVIFSFFHIWFKPLLIVHYSIYFQKENVWNIWSNMCTGDKIMWMNWKRVYNLSSYTENLTKVKQLWFGFFLFFFLEKVKHMVTHCVMRVDMVKINCFGQIIWAYLIIVLYAHTHIHRKFEFVSGSVWWWEIEITGCCVCVCVLQNVIFSSPYCRIQFITNVKLCGTSIGKDNNRMEWGTCWLHVEFKEKQKRQKKYEILLVICSECTVHGSFPFVK